jgi:hypothetical protein
MMREDYLAGLDPYLLPIPTRLNNTYRLDLLSVPAAEVLCGLAGAAGVPFQAEAPLSLPPTSNVARSRPCDASIVRSGRCSDSCTDPI